MPDRSAFLAQCLRQKGEKSATFFAILFPEVALSDIVRLVYRHCQMHLRDVCRVLLRGRHVSP